MPKDTGTEFGDTWHYPYYSVCTTSSHDMAGIRGWWESDRDATQRFYSHVLHESGNAPHFAEPWICDKIISLHLESPSMLCILPLQDWMSCDGSLRRENPNDEQINDPSNPRHYWRYRMHLTVEEFMRKDSLTLRCGNAFQNPRDDDEHSLKVFDSDIDVHAPASIHGKRSMHFGYNIGGG